MTDPFDDDTRFWDESASVRTGPVERVAVRDRTGPFERTRTHRVVAVDVRPPATGTFEDFAPDDDDAWAGVDQWVEPLEDRRRAGFVGIDPTLLRIGAVGLVGVLMIPIALALRDDAGDGMRSEDAVDVAVTGATELLGDPATTVVAVPITAAAIAPVTAPAVVPSAGSADEASAPAALAAAPAEAACAGTYVVIANDFWNRFPKTSGASVQEWLSANDATADTPLYVGDELCIPAGAIAPTPPPPPTTTQPPATTAAPTTQAPATTQAAPPPPPAPPPAATTTPATQPPAPLAPTGPVPGATDPATVEAMIRKIWPDDVEERALTIAKRESGLRPWVRNYCCYGVFAIYFDMGRNWLPGLGITSAEQLFDARTNIAAAYHLYTLAGWRPWAQTDPG